MLDSVDVSLARSLIRERIHYLNNDHNYENREVAIVELSMILDKLSKMNPSKEVKE